ncbi:MAG: hypothetical protein L6Q45_16280 [Anaerolineales bacterium]|nr:hypothetical protein [Anaerolineales bacterium]
MDTFRLRAAEQSVRLTGGILRHLHAFFYTQAESCPKPNPRPPQRR